MIDLEIKNDESLKKSTLSHKKLPKGMRGLLESQRAVPYKKNATPFVQGLDRYLEHSLETQVKSALCRRRMSTLDILYTRGIIDAMAYAAGTALAQQWEQAHIGVSTSLIDGNRIDGISAAHRKALPVRQTEALDKINKALFSQNERGRLLLLAVCIQGKNFQDIQQETGWQAKYVSERFKEAIHELALHYGFKATHLH